MSPVVHPGLPCWSPSEQSYPPLGRPQATQPPELFERAGRGPSRLAAVEAAVKDIQIISGREFVPSPTNNSEVQEDIGKVRLAGTMIKFQKRPGRGATSGGVGVDLTSKTVMPEGMDVRSTARGKDAEGDRLEVVLSMIAGGASSSTSSRRRLCLLLRRRPQPTLLGWRWQQHKQVFNAIAEFNGWDDN